MDFNGSQDLAAGLVAWVGAFSYVKSFDCLTQSGFITDESIGCAEVVFALKSLILTRRST